MLGCGKPEPSGHADRPIAPTMSYLGASWLDRADRAEREQPEAVLDALKLRPTDTVADVGAGTGYFTLRLARRVKQVIATDLQPEMLTALRSKITTSNISLRVATASDSGLPARCCDLVLLVDVYHELAEPESVLSSIRAALKPGGRLVLVEYRGEDPAVAIKPEHKMTLAQIRKELADWQFQTSMEFLPDQRVVVFTP